MAATNDITGDNIATKYNTNQYRTNWDLIFGSISGTIDGSTVESEKPNEDSSSDKT